MFAKLKIAKSFVPAAVIVAVCMLGYQALAVRKASGPTKPAIVATFDVEKTFLALKEKAAADARLRKLAEDFKTSTTERAAQIKQLEDDLAIHKPGTAKHRELTHKWMDSSYQYRGFVEFAQQELQAESARSLKKIYATISAMVDRIATENGYAVVFLDDSVQQISGNTEREITAQIAARRMVFTHPDIDITDTLVERLNSQYQSQTSGTGSAQ